ncbi:hypothetical protein MMPV_001761 [Pyropia vietnamensis]
MGAASSPRSRTAALLAGVMVPPPHSYPSLPRLHLRHDVAFAAAPSGLPPILGRAAGPVVWRVPRRPAAGGARRRWRRPLLHITMASPAPPTGTPTPSPRPSSAALPSTHAPAPVESVGGHRVANKNEYVCALRATLGLDGGGGWAAQPPALAATDLFWHSMQAEARAAAAKEPLLASFLFNSVLNHRTLGSALAFHLANKLASAAMPATLLVEVCREVLAGGATVTSGYPALGWATSLGGNPGAAAAAASAAAAAAAMDRTLRLDLLAVMERDPACTQLIDALLYFKGFHALQAHRVAHALWTTDRRPLAYFLQSQVSKRLQVDVHPAAVVGAGAFWDHATGLVIGETAVLGNNVSLLHSVTLGGSGKKHGVRHPRLGDGVLVGAGATLLGPVKVGAGAQVGACSLVLEDVAPHVTVVGVPAKVVGVPGVAVPALHMRHERCMEAEAQLANLVVERNGGGSEGNEAASEGNGVSSGGNGVSTGGNGATSGGNGATPG